MEPALLDRYLTAAAKIARVAVGDPSVPPAVERYTAVKGNANEQTWLWQTDRLGEDFPLGSRGGIAARHYFPVDGEYDLRVGWRGPTPTSSAACRCRARSRSAWTACGSGRFTIGGPAVAAESQDADEPLHVRVPVKAGLAAGGGDHRQVRRREGRGAGTRAHPDLEPRSRRADVPARASRRC